MTPVSRSTQTWSWWSGRSAQTSMARGWKQSTTIVSRPPWSAVPSMRQSPVDRTFWQKPARVDERLRQRLHRERGVWPVDGRCAGQVLLVEAANARPDRPLRGHLRESRVGAHRGAVRQPDLVVALRAPLRVASSSPARRPWCWISASMRVTVSPPALNVRSSMRSRSRSNRSSASRMNVNSSDSVGSCAGSAASSGRRRSAAGTGDRDAASQGRRDIEPKSSAAGLGVWLCRGPDFDLTTPGPRVILATNRATSHPDRGHPQDDRHVPAPRPAPRPIRWARSRCPAEHYWGAQTQRSLHHFAISQRHDAAPRSSGRSASSSAPRPR